MSTPRILCIEDEADVSALVSHVLTRAGYRVETAATGREALSRIAQAHPTLILLDLMLPDIDGFALCEILRHDRATATIPIMLLSGWSSPESRHVGLELGALDYVVKPFSPRDLLQRVKRLMEIRSVPA
jgi:two-component system alkaline phosphatase synthesis response regulator PhoP